MDSLWRAAAVLAEETRMRPHTTADGWDIVQALSDRADAEEFGWVGGIVRDTDVVADTLVEDVTYDPRTRTSRAVNRVKRHG